MWNMVELSNGANSGQGRNGDEEGGDACSTTALRQAAAMFNSEMSPEGAKHSIPKLPAVINQQMSQEQVCMSEFWGHGR